MDGTCGEDNIDVMFAMLPRRYTFQFASVGRDEWASCSCYRRVIRSSRCSPKSLYDLLIRSIVFPWVAQSALP